MRLNIVFSLLAFVLTIFVAQARPPKDMEFTELPGGRTLAACNGPTSRAELDINNVRALLHNGGDAWWDRVAAPRYEVPKVNDLTQVKKHSMFGGGIWIGARDPEGVLLVAAQTYRSQANQDSYWPGPLESDGKTDRSICLAWDRHFKVNKSVVDEFASTWVPGISLAEIPQEVLNWPGKGNPWLGNPLNPYYIPNFASVDLDKNLAKFIDSDGDGIYDPTKGDYPMLPGAEEGSGADQCIFYIVNDEGGGAIKQAFAPPIPANIGMEIQTEAFAYSTSDAANNMTFYRQTLINKGAFEFEGTYFGQWADPDLGNAYDDYVECDVVRGLGICYNGDDFDDGVFGYGFNPPSVGVDFFRGPFSDEGDGVDNDKDGVIDELDTLPDPFDPAKTLILTERIILSNFVYYNNDGDPKNGNPSQAIHFFNYLQNVWRDGTRASYDGLMGRTPVGSPSPKPEYNVTNGAVGQSNFIFPGFSDQKITANGDCWNPNCPPAWTERSAGNPIGDRRFLSSAGPFTLRPGMINEMTIGVVWARASSGGATGSFNQLRSADDIAQKLFDNGFQILNGPNAPNLEIVELDKKLVITIVPDTFRLVARGAIMNTESYIERDRSLRESDGDVFYRFQGYKVYQLIRDNVSTGELDDQDKARLIFQCDIKDGIARVVNTKYSPELDAEIPTIMVEGNDAGISNSIVIDNDVFATDRDQLINFKKYYFLVVAYGHNGNEKNKEPYLQGRNNVRVYTGIPHKPAPTNGGTVIRAEYGDALEVIRQQGLGTGGNSIEVSDSIVAKMLEMPYDVFNVNYKQGRVPILAKVINPKEVIDADFTLKLSSKLAINRSGLQFELQKGDSLFATLDFTSWKDSKNHKNLANIPQVNGIGVVKNVVNNTIIDVATLNADKGGRFTVLIDSVDDQSRFQGYFEIPCSLTVKRPGGGTQTIQSVKWDPYEFSSLDLVSNNSVIRNVYTSLPNGVDKLLLDYGISVKLNNILGPGVKHLENRINGYRATTFSYQNGAGGYLGATNTSWLLNAQRLIELNVDLAGIYLTAGERMLAPYAIAELSPASTSFGPVFARVSTSFGTSDRVKALQRLHNVDLVITPDKSKWTRVVVLQADSTSPQLRFNKSLAISKDIDGNVENRNSPYTHNGNALRSKGMSWFPGYAIDHDMGRRLQIVLSESKVNRPAIGDQPSKGNDLIWNPSTNGTGDREFVYITTQTYDEGARFEFFLDSLAENGKNLSGPAYEFVKNNGLFNYISWVGNFSFNEGFGDIGPYNLPSDAVLKIRVDRGFTAINGKEPEYFISTRGLSVKTNQTQVAKDALSDIRIVPNPYYANSLYETSQVDNRVKFVNLPRKCTINIYTLNGKFIRQYKKDDNLTYLDWDLKTAEQFPIASGAYVIYVDAGDLGSKVLKWFGVIRPIDLDTF